MGRPVSRAQMADVSKPRNGAAGERYRADGIALAVVVPVASART